MYVAIDMSEHQLIQLVLFDKDHCHRVTQKGQNADMLSFLKITLETYQIDPMALQGIAVVVGKGTFTSTRLAVTVANTFQYVNKTPLLAISAEELEDIKTLLATCEKKVTSHFLSATYSGAPRIHQKK